MNFLSHIYVLSSFSTKIYDFLLEFFQDKAKFMSYVSFNAFKVEKHNELERKSPMFAALTVEAFDYKDQTTPRPKIRIAKKL